MGLLWVGAGVGGAGFEIRQGEISGLSKWAPFSPTTTQAGIPVAKGSPQRPNRGSGPPWGRPTAPHTTLCAQLPPVLSMAMMSSMWPCGAAHEPTDQPLSPPSAPLDPLGWLGARGLGGWPPSGHHGARRSPLGVCRRLFCRRHIANSRQVVLSTTIEGAG